MKWYTPERSHFHARFVANHLGWMLASKIINYCTLEKSHFHAQFVANLLLRRALITTTISYTLGRSNFPAPSAGNHILWKGASLIIKNHTLKKRSVGGHPVRKHLLQSMNYCTPKNINIIAQCVGTVSGTISNLLKHQGTFLAQCNTYRCKL